LLVAMNAVGCAGRWWIEQNQRTQFATQLLLRSQAMTDPLTGLANRRGLHRGLEGAMHIAKREGKYLAIALLDLDRFKPINDRFGHAAGDDVLREVASRLRVVARRSTDTVARLGGDEFAVIWAARSIADLYALADRLHETTREISMRFGEGEAGLADTSASLGVLVVRKPDPFADFGKLLDRADGLSMMVKRIGGRAMILREWEEPKRLRMKAMPEPDGRPRFRVGAA
jgi:diguanylate cyclase (GGDEF)-like protein